ncbi:unnamed protein product [Clonostachys solani]|uniref:Uncharacterized protein n=1 Tax=Clonostachys solani TaxID=160281 RepID=A0A9P0EQH6_9HYPO|nr:unnamed protein product [Clonostachys solani]
MPDSANRQGPVACPTINLQGGESLMLDACVVPDRETVPDGPLPASGGNSHGEVGFDSSSLNYSIGLDHIESHLPLLSPTFPQAVWDEIQVLEGASQQDQPERLDHNAQTLSPGRDEFLAEPISADVEPLVAHFLSISSLPRFIPSISETWSADRHTIWSMGNTFRPLENAIYAFVDTHSSCIVGSDPILARKFHETSAAGVQQALCAQMMDSNRLQQLMATVLLLTWRGIGRRLYVWLRLLDHKILFAGRETSSSDEDQGPESSEIAHSPSGSADDDAEYSAGRPEDWVPSEGLPITSPAAAFDMLYAITNHAPFTFYLKTQRIKDRITLLNRWNRARGSLDEEIEVLQLGKRIDRDLVAHWASRPALLDMGTDPNLLRDGLQPQLAHRLASQIRLYRADFFAHVIYLHRVAFRVFAKETKVESAIREVLQLARLECVVTTTQSSGNRREDEAPALTDTAPEQSPNGEPLSPSWLWPLFMVAVEGTRDDFAKVEAEFGRMIAVTGTLDHALAPSALCILRALNEQVRVGGGIVDYRMIQDQLFSGKLHII